jgi:hypothetical protein
MTNAEQVLHPASVAPPGLPAQAVAMWGQNVRNMANRLGAGIVRFIDDYAKARAAEAMYGQLSRLSDAELRRRGLARAELHQWIFTAGR